VSASCTHAALRALVADGVCPLCIDDAPRGSGKWGRSDVPKTGWRWDGVRDLGPESEAICEMCETRRIRYEHVMRHDEYPSSIHAGCICAGQMAGDVVAAKERERELRQRSERRGRWLARTWRVSRAGNQTLTIDDRRVTVFCRDSCWSWVIRGPGEGVQFSVDGHASADAAKLSAFDVLDPPPWSSAS